MLVKTSELIGAGLQWATAQAVYQGLRHKYGNPCFDPKSKRVYQTEGLREIGVSWRPDKDWRDAGSIIEREIDCIRKRSEAEESELAYPNPNFKFKAEIFADIAGYYCGFGPTALVAAMRCYVASVFGDTVDIPEELM